MTEVDSMAERNWRERPADRAERRAVQLLSLLVSFILAAGFTYLAVASLSQDALSLLVALLPLLFLWSVVSALVFSLSPDPRAHRLREAWGTVAVWSLGALALAVVLLETAVRVGSRDQAVLVGALALVLWPLAALFVLRIARCRQALRESHKISGELAAVEAAPAPGHAARGDELTRLLADPPGRCYAVRGEDGPESVRIFVHSQPGCAGLALCGLVLLAGVSAGFVGNALEMDAGVGGIASFAAALVTYLIMFLCALFLWDATARFRFKLTPARLVAERNWLMFCWLKCLALDASGLAGIAIERAQGNMGVVHAAMRTEGTYSIHRDGLTPAGWLAEVISAYYGLPLADGDRQIVPPSRPDAGTHDA
jgi:hypothetical protein